MRLPKTWLAFALTVPLLAFAGSLTGPAPASATSWNEKWFYTHFPPTSKDNRCVIRWITTGPGYYRWQLLSYHWAHPDPNRVSPRRIWLRRATYRWVDCWAAQRVSYRHNSRLFNETHGGMVEIKGDFQYGGYGDGQYRWASRLDRVR